MKPTDIPAEFQQPMDMIQFALDHGYRMSTYEAFSRAVLPRTVGRGDYDRAREILRFIRPDALCWLTSGQSILMQR